jgi:hypothetical protein
VLFICRSAVAKASDYYNRNMGKTTGADSKFFTTNRKGENHELREELRSPQRDRKRDAVKKVYTHHTFVA